MSTLSKVTGSVETSQGGNALEPNQTRMSSVNGRDCVHLTPAESKEVKIFTETINSSDLPAESFPFELLPDEMKLEVLKKLDLRDQGRFAQTGSYWNSLVTDHQILRHIAIQIGCPIREGSSIAPQVSDFIVDLWKKTINVKNRPKDILKILKKPTIDNLKYLQKWLIARDTLVVWQKLAESATKQMPDVNLSGPGLNNTSNEVIAKAAEFSGWFSENQDVLVQLQELNLVDNQLTSLPNLIGNLTQLQELFLAKNQLTSLPNWIGNLTQLQGLGLNFNQLAELPNVIGNLAQLQSLGLGNNKLISLPSEVNKLTRLQNLYLAYNQLISLPNWIGNLNQLQVLNLRDNKLTSLPGEIGELIHLEMLNLNNNQLTELPDEINTLKTMHSLQELYVDGNGLT